MKLSKICEEIEYTLLQGSLETEVRDIIYDSRNCLLYTSTMH